MLWEQQYNNLLVGHPHISILFFLHLHRHHQLLECENVAVASVWIRNIWFENSMQPVEYRSQPQILPYINHSDINCYRAESKRNLLAQCAERNIACNTFTSHWPSVFMCAFWPQSQPVIQMSLRLSQRQIEKMKMPTRSSDDDNYHLVKHPTNGDITKVCTEHQAERVKGIGTDASMNVVRLVLKCRITRFCTLRSFFW